MQRPGAVCLFLVSIFGFSTAFELDPFAGSLSKPRKCLVAANFAWIVPHCSGRQEFTGLIGNFTDGSFEEKYRPNSKCEFLIHPPNVNHVVLTVDYLLLESGYDVEACSSDNITIFDGPTSLSPILAVLCGSSALGRKIVSTSPEVLVVFRSDSFVQKEGFSLSYTTELCRGCQNGGRCVGHNQCICLFGWTGDNCEVPVCEPPCQNGGTCVKPNQCACLGYWERRNDAMICVT